MNVKDLIEIKLTATAFLDFFNKTIKLTVNLALQNVKPAYKESNKLTAFLAKEIIEKTTLLNACVYKGFIKKIRNVYSVLNNAKLASISPTVPAARASSEITKTFCVRAKMATFKIQIHLSAKSVTCSAKNALELALTVLCVKITPIEKIKYLSVNAFKISFKTRIILFVKAALFNALSVRITHLTVFLARG